MSSPPVIPTDPEPSHTDTFDVEDMEVTTKDGTFNAGNRLIGRSVWKGMGVCLESSCSKYVLLVLDVTCEIVNIGVYIIY